MKKQTYQYTIYYRDPQDNTKDKALSPIKSVEAVSEEHAKRIAIRSLGAEWDEKLHFIELTVKPFLSSPEKAEAATSSLASVIAAEGGRTPPIPPLPASSGAWQITELDKQDGFRTFAAVKGIRLLYTFSVRPQTNGIGVFPIKQYSIDAYQHVADAAAAVFSHCMKNNIR